MQIKIFEGSSEQNEAEANAWLRDNPQIEIINVNMVPMHDRYSFGQGEICNQWVATIITYKEG